MPKFSVDYDQMAQSLTRKAIKLETVRDRLEKVGFDIVRFKDADKCDELWQIQNSDDGDYIVALYQEPEEAGKVVQASTLPWKVMVGKLGDLNIFYKNDPIIRISASKLGIPNDEAYLVSRYLPKKLIENKQLVHSLLNELPKTTRQEVINKYPELS